jgi:hypothetical protein
MGHPSDAFGMYLFHHLNKTLRIHALFYVCKSSFFLTFAEKDDLVNLLMRHAGNSSNSTQRTDFPCGHSSQADTQSRVQSSMVQDQPRQHFQEQGSSTAACLSAQCSTSTSERLLDNGYLVNSSYSY